MTVLDILIAMRELLAVARHWTRGTFARTAAGQPCDANDLEAACWCVAGAAIHVSRHAFDRDDAVRAIRALLSAVGASGIADWNDAPERTHAEVLAGLDHAIKIERAAA